MSSEGKDLDRELFAVGDQIVCILLIGYLKVLQQTFWNTNSGGIRSYKQKIRNLIKESGSVKKYSDQFNLK